MAGDDVLDFYHVILACLGLEITDTSEPTWAQNFSFPSELIKNGTFRTSHIRSMQKTGTARTRRISRSSAGDVDAEQILVKIDQK